MNASPSRLTRPLVAAAWAVALGFITACGGIGSIQIAGGVGSGGTGLAEGVITGFGSVIVEGVRYDDSKASTVQDTETGTEEMAEPRLGQRARVTYDASGAALRIQLLPQLRGVVEQVDGSEFVLLGQRVRVVADNASGMPATQWSDGYSRVAVGDAIEVHGSWSRDGQSRGLLIASRIDVLDASPEVVLLTAPVRQQVGDVVVLDDTLGSRVRVRDLPADLKPGALVSTWIARSTMMQSQPWAALRTRDASALAQGGADGDPSILEVYGLADNGPQGIRLQGVPIGDRADPPPPGSSVKVRLVRRNSQWVTDSVTQLSGGNALRTIELKGVLTWNPASTLLNLRGVTVRYGPAALDNSCRNLGSGVDVYLEVQASSARPGEPLQATSIECSLSLPAIRLRSDRAILTRVSPDSVSVRLPDGITLDLRRETNSFLQRSPEFMLGRAVDIEYSQQAGTYTVLRKLKEVRE